MKKNKIIIFTLCLIGCLVLTGCGDSKEKKIAIESFNAEVSRIEKQIADRDLVVESAEALIAAGKVALDETLVPALNTTIVNAKAITIELPKIPSDLEKINTAIKELNTIDNSEIITAVSDAQTKLEKSIKQYEQVVAPKEAFIIERLKTVADIAVIAAVTEDNDPNGKLNKAGGYTASIYFSSNLVDQSKASGNSVIDKGTDCGGNIEVYATVEDANKRNSYLAVFDGTLFASGSHKVVGTIIVRTSNLLKASQQNKLEADIVNALTALVN